MDIGMDITIGTLKRGRESTNTDHLVSADVAPQFNPFPVRTRNDRLCHVHCRISPPEHRAYD
jgi:hypothetical protein